MRTAILRFSALGLLLVGTVHCGSASSEPEPPEADAGVDAADDASTDVDQPDASPCVPKICADTEQCGTYEDGCGGTIACDASCVCTPNDFERTCPPRPCEVVAGCTDSRCMYAPVTCGEAGAEKACVPVDCSGDGCGNVATAPGEEQKLYPCGGKVCAETTQYCDPTPKASGGTVVFENRCVSRPVVTCGACDLGVASCDTSSDRYVCNDIPQPVLDVGSTEECDSTVVGSTFVFLDVEYTGGSSDGSRERPYTSYGAAIGAALSRNARGIVIAGSPVFTEPMQIADGVSVYGGFQGAPSWIPDRALRPRWEVPASAASGTKLVGAVAKNVTKRTVLYHLRIETQDVTAAEQGQGVSNVALWVEESKGLVLDDVLVQAGAAGNGIDGTNGAQGDTGAAAVGSTPGEAGASCQTTCDVTRCNDAAKNPSNPAPPASNTKACGAGGQLDGDYGLGAVAGNPSRASCQGEPAALAGGAAGQDSITWACSVEQPATSGGTGRDGAAGSPGADAFVAELVGIEGANIPVRARRDGTDGGRGEWGSGGGAGGSHSIGCVPRPNRGGVGGGAGGPGCGGTRGTGGGGGGVSIGMAVVGASGNVEVRRSTIRGGLGGKGGAAGAGGHGGTGAEGAEGAPGTIGDDTSESARPGKGGKGGKGGTGGRGGHGSGGAGGSSFGVFCTSAAMSIIRDGSTSFIKGTGGSGGTSSGSSGRPGEATDVASCGLVNG